jgi:hypothetical protein
MQEWNFAERFYSFAKIVFSKRDKFTAASLLAVALDEFTYMDVHCGRADCMLYLGEIAREQGQLSRASALWKEARLLFEQSLQAKKVSEVDGRLAELEQSHETDLNHLSQLNVPNISAQNQLLIVESSIDEGQEGMVE